MNRKHATSQYTTSTVADRKAGSAGLELYRETKDGKDCVARILFWDASGQFVLETFNNIELPLDIVEELIAEAKDVIKTK